MLRSRAAWINSRPGSRWRISNAIKSTTALPSAFSLVKFKYQGGRYIIAGAYVSGSVENIRVGHSANLTSWVSATYINFGKLPIVDVACDGTYIYFALAHSTLPNVTTVIRRGITTGSFDQIDIPGTLKTLDCRTDNSLIYTCIGGYGYISSWPTYNNVPDSEISTPLGFAESAGTLNSVILSGEVPGFRAFSYTGSFSSVPMNIPTTAEAQITSNDRIGNPQPIYTSNQFVLCWPFVGDLPAGGPTYVSIFGLQFIAGPDFQRVDPSSASYVFSSRVSDKPISFLVLRQTGDMYILFNTSLLLRSNNNGATFQPTPIVGDPKNLLTLTASPLGVIAAATDRTLYISP